MLRVTKLTDYATVVMAALASAPERVHSAAELAERARLEPTTVAKVLKPLAQAGLVDGFRGASGGYRLARPARDIALIAIVEAIEGPLGMTECSGEHSSCEHEPHCGVQTHWRRINDVIAQTLSDITLADMLPRAAVGKSIPLQLAAARG
ncbi:MAG: SUF system Fe-S cluster assembly regulator [Arenimonas sp.]|nr:SUF system Fe-S cluster assembly regulator [Arenimonas sp.]MBP6626433.1 SUF system Fe-S cluster assembly regulator [Arenimonas sp.]